MTTLTLSESFAAVLFQLVIGGVGGFFVGYAMKKILSCPDSCGDNLFFDIFGLHKCA